MALRDELFSIDDVVNASQGFLGASQALRQNAARQAVLTGTQSGESDPLRLAGLAFEAGDPTALREVIQNKTRPATGSAAKTPIPKPVLEQIFGRDKAAFLVDQPFDTQQAAINAMEGQQRAASTNRALTIQENAEGRRTEEVPQKQRYNVQKVTEPIFKQILQEQRQIANIDEALKQDTAAADNLIFTFLARRVLEEKGPLSNEDVSRLQTRVGFNDVQQLRNFITGKNLSMLTDDQKKAFRDLINVGKKNFEIYKERELSDVLSRLVRDNPKLIKGPNEVDPALQERISQAGLEWKDGRLVGAEKKETLPQDSKKAQLLIKAEAIKDPALRQRALRKINSASEDQLNDQVMQQFEAAILKAVGSK